ncbi:MAG: tRNA pseudouridine(38-40) synthase TruA [Nitrospirae bacterium]|nr:MAG: tRNA pseudouridine(38-40) synthase TruA [Nitrospirota bacterium]
MKNIKLLMEYDGTNYHGWQEQNLAISQRNIVTIQGMLRENIKAITGEDVKVIGSSRTDAGVHALGQVASFLTDSYLEPAVLQRALNSLLPEDIKILDAEEVNEAFHPRYDAVSKSYFYLISNMSISSAFLYRYAWRVPHRLDMDSMKEAGSLLKGRHDFSAFRGAGCGAKTTEREIISFDIERLERIDFMTAGITGDFIKIRIEANAFLRHMVRNIVGTLIEIGRGKMAVNSISAAFEHRDRKRTGPTAPAKGLFLEKINY